MVSFKSGRIIKKFKAKDGREVVIRTVKYSDLRQTLSYINELVAEDTFILVCRKKSLREEREWLKKSLKGMKNGKEVVIVAEIDKKIVCCSNLKKLSDRSPHVGEFGISVLKQYRNLGIGKEMVKQIIEISRDMKFKIILLGVFANNKAALSLYKKFGFRQVGRAPKIFLYKGKYVDDIWMMKKL
jgi:ribosomal protein S18 acetylase RimI-like enzyme